MARQVGGGSFRASEFFNDDELLMGLKMKRLNDFRDGYANSFGFSPDLGSPFESFLGSGETESDEDDYLTRLAQKLAYASFRDSNFPAEKTMDWKLSDSPQSTLCSAVTGCRRCMPGLSRVSRVSVPPDGGNAVAWRSLLAAAERDARMRLIEASAAFCSGNPSFPSRKSETTSDFTQGSGFYSNQSRFSYQELQAAQFQQLKQQMVRNVKKNEVSGNQNSTTAAPWPEILYCQPQSQRCSAMKSHFIGESETKSKRTGTGVFLPRRNLGAAPVETRKKTDRLVQGMNFNLKSMENLQQSQSLNKGNALKHGNPVSITLGQVPARLNQELKLQLPQEWTY